MNLILLHLGSRQIHILNACLLRVMCLSFMVPKGCDVINKSLSDAIADFPTDLAGYDAYVGGPVQLLPAVIKALTRKGLKQESIKVDSFGG